MKLPKIAIKWLSYLLLTFSVDPGFKSRPGTGYPEVFMVSLSPSREMPG
jgi:hypothetical protein